MSRAAEKPLPPPPPGSVWERIEAARGSTPYAKFSQDAGRSPAQYRNNALNGWKSTATIDAYVGLLVQLGYRREWLLLGQLPARADDATAPIATERRLDDGERRDREWVAAALIASNVPEAQAYRAALKMPWEFAPDAPPEVILGTARVFLQGEEAERNLKRDVPTYKRSPSGTFTQTEPPERRTKKAR